MVPTESEFVKVRSYLAKRFGEDIAQEVVLRLLEQLHKGKTTLKNYDHFQNYAVRSAHNLKRDQFKGGLYDPPLYLLGVDSFEFIRPNDLERHGGEQYSYQLMDGVAELPLRILSTVEGQMAIAKLKQPKHRDKLRQLHEYRSGESKVTRQRVQQIQKELKKVI